MDDIGKTKLSPSEIMKQWKIGRTKLYDLMNEGKLSYEKTPTGKRRIDLSEAVRALGEPDSDHTSNIPHQSFLLVQALQKQLEMQEKSHEQYIQALQDRIDAQQKQIDTMADVVHLLKHSQPQESRPTVAEEPKQEAKPTQQPVKRKRSLFGRLLAAAIDD